MKPRSDSMLFKLAPDQQAQLYRWIHTLGYRGAKDQLAKPPPDGFGVKTHLNSLTRFVQRYAEMQKEREFFDMLRCASGELDPEIACATESFAHHMAFNIATSPQRDLKKFRQIARWVMMIKDERLRNRWADLELQRLNLELQRLNDGGCQPASDKFL